MNAVSDEINVPRTTLVKAFHCNSDGQWKEMCVGFLDLQRYVRSPTPPTSGVCVSLSDPNSRNSTILAYRIGDDVEVVVDPTSGMQLTWFDQNFRCNVALSFPSAITCQWSYSRINSFRSADGIAFAKVDLTVNHFNHVVSVLSRCLAGTRVYSVTEVLDELLRDEYWERCWMFDAAPIEKRVSFYRSVLRLNSLHILTKIVDTPEYLSSLLNVLSQDKALIGIHTIDHNAVLEEQRQRLRNNFSVAPHIMQLLQRLHVVLYIRECVVPQILEDPTCDSSSRLLYDCREQLINEISIEPSFLQELKKIGRDPILSPDLRSKDIKNPHCGVLSTKDESLLSFLDGLLHNARCLTEASATTFLEKLTEGGFATALYNVLTVLPSRVANLLSSVELVSLSVLRRLIVYPVKEGDQHHHENIMSALMSYVLDVTVPLRSSRLFMDLMCNVLDVSKIPTPPSARMNTESLSYESVCALDDAAQNMLDYLYSSRTYHIRALFENISQQSMLNFLKLIEPCIRTHGVRAVHVMSEYRMFGILDMWFSEADHSRDQQTPNPTTLLTELRLQILRVLQVTIQSRETGLIQMVTESEIVPHILQWSVWNALRESSQSYPRITRSFTPYDLSTAKSVSSLESGPDNSNEGEDPRLRSEAGAISPVNGRLSGTSSALESISVNDARGADANYPKVTSPVPLRGLSTRRPSVHCTRGLILNSIAALIEVTRKDGNNALIASIFKESYVLPGGVHDLSPSCVESTHRANSSSAEASSFMALMDIFSGTPLELNLKKLHKKFAMSSCDDATQSKLVRA